MYHICVYRSNEEVAIVSSAEVLDFLASDFTEPIRDPLWGNIFLSPALERIAESSPFAKLGRIKQLGPAFLVYPGATHTRRAHSIGVFHMAKRLVWALAAKGQLDFCSLEGINSYLVAALCHDLGHFPFAHSLKDLPLEEHEVLTARELLTEPLRNLVLAAGADPDVSAAIVDESLPDRDNREIRFFRGLLSGVLDPDKLDYLNRDAFFCGVPYGLQDSDFVLQRVNVGPGDALAIEERGLMSIEGLLFSKYLMYRSVYWHKGVRSATAMIKKAVLLALREGVLTPDQLYGLDDDGFYAKLRSIDYGPFTLADSVFEGRVYETVFDIPFDPSDSRHQSLLDLETRLEFETSLSAVIGLGSLDLVVDIPEVVSFETNLPVILGEGGSMETPSPAELGSASKGKPRKAVPFSESPTVFSPPVVAGFARSLRRLRVFARSPSAELEAELGASLV
jgi:HD superfamily phosphohydrolase